MPNKFKFTVTKISVAIPKEIDTVKHMKPKTELEALKLLTASLSVYHAFLTLMDVPSEHFGSIINNTVMDNDPSETAVKFYAKVMLEARDKIDAYRVEHPFNPESL